MKNRGRNTEMWASRPLDSALPVIAAAGGGLLLISFLIRRRGIMGITFVAPIPSKQITSGWGRPREYRNGIHRGIDIPAPRGTTIYSATSGVIERLDAVDDSFAGRWVQVKTGPVRVRYMHLDRHAEGLKQGQSVRQGQVIGYVGTTGVQNSGPHLHLDIYAEKSFVDAYTAKFGIPRGGFPEFREGIGYAVPAEALIPAAGYAGQVVVDARSNNVSLISA